VNLFFGFALLLGRFFKLGARGGFFRFGSFNLRDDFRQRVLVAGKMFASRFRLFGVLLCEAFEFGDSLGVGASSSFLARIDSSIAELILFSNCCSSARRPSVCSLAESMVPWASSTFRRRASSWSVISLMRFSSAESWLRVT